jgi:hypothetical protein
MNEVKEPQLDRNRELRADVLYIVFDLIYTLWAATGPAIGIALLGLFAYAFIGEKWVVTVTVILCVVALVGGIFLARFLRKAGRGRGGMAGAMAPHATPDLDRDESDSSRA